MSGINCRILVFCSYFIVITCVIYGKGTLYCKILKFFNVICWWVICEHVFFMCLTLLVSIVSGGRPSNE
jgi:hypothetical protein